MFGNFRGREPKGRHQLPRDLGDCDYILTGQVGCERENSIKAPYHFYPTLGDMVQGRSRVRREISPSHVITRDLPCGIWYRVG